MTPFLSGLSIPNHPCGMKPNIEARFREHIVKEAVELVAESSSTLFDNFAVNPLGRKFDAASEVNVEIFEGHSQEKGSLKLSQSIQRYPAGAVILNSLEEGRETHDAR
jgi:hypothetical protein